MRPVEIHRKAREVIRQFSKEVRLEFGSALLKAQMGMALGLPLSRPMPDVFPGAHEFRFRDAAGIQWIFYYLQSQRAIPIFHAFTKKSAKTPQAEIKLGRKRLLEMLNDEKT